MTGDDYGADLGTWNSFVRRVRVNDPKRKLAALIFSSYANPDGTSIKCGAHRFAADCEMGFSTARRYMAWLREVGLIELVRPGNHKAKRADEYRLIIGPAAYKYLDVIDEAEYRDLVEESKITNRDAQKRRRLLLHQRSPKEVSADTTDSADPISAHPKK